MPPADSAKDAPAMKPGGKVMKDKINHPEHYTRYRTEVIDITRYLPLQTWILTRTPARLARLSSSS